MQIGIIFTLGGVPWFFFFSQRSQYEQFKPIFSSSEYEEGPTNGYGLVYVFGNQQSGYIEENQF